MFSKNTRKIKITEQEIEPQEVFLDQLAQKKEQEVGMSERKFEVPLSQRKLKFFYFGFLLLVIFLFVQTLKFQIINGEEFRNLAEKNCQNVQFGSSIRGVIYDSAMNQLVFNKTSYDLIANVKNLPSSESEKIKVISGIANLISEDQDSLNKQISESDFDIVLIKENLAHESLILLKTKINDFPGFEIKENTVRDYKEAENFSQILGFTGKITKEELKSSEKYSITDYIGKQGLEDFYENVLRGEPSRVLIEKDVLGEKIFEKTISESKPGKSLVLWLDSDLQKKLQGSLKNELEKVGSKRGAAVVVDPNTGGVLAMVSLPSFDNNLFSQGIEPEELKKINENPNQPLFNRAVSGGYQVGSTIKPLIASAVLQENMISPKKQILCEGSISIPNPYNPDKPSIFLDWTTHGWTDLRKAIAESCDVYFYTVGGGYGDVKGLGVDRIDKYLKLFGWGTDTEVDITSENPGRIPDPEWKENYFKDPQSKIWRIGDTYHLSIGQGDILVSPLQEAIAYGAIANGGKLYQPQIVKEIIEGSADSVKSTQKIEPQIIREGFIDPANLQIVREGMRDAVIYGSSITLNDLPIKVGAKTGTAQVSKKDFYNNWVTVIAPIDNPQIVVTIVLEDVKGLQSAALPVAKEVLNWYFSK